MFIIGPDGRVGKVKVRSELGPAYDQALLAAVNKLPRFEPGKQEGKPVAVFISMGVGYSAPYKAPAPAATPTKERVAPGWPVFMQQLTSPAYLTSGQRLDQAIERRLLPLPAGGKAPAQQFFFIVTEKGKIEDVFFTKSMGERYERAILQAMSLLPTFEPGRVNDQAVPTLMYQAITFPQNAELPTGIQQPLPPYDSTKVYLYVERMPALPGKEEEPVGNGVVSATGIKESKLVSELRRRLVVPAEVAQGKVDGVVQVSFTVGPSGAHYNHQIHKSLSPACDAAALAAVAKLPRFIPGQQSGRAVAVSFTVALPFFGPAHVFESYEVPQRAVFPGGKEAVYTYLSEKQRAPAVMQQEKLSGYVTAKFVVGADGRVRTPQIVRGLCTSCDAEALRLLQAMPAWAPARNAQGQAVATTEHLEIRMPSASAGAR
ncbi:energy transducer TonB [uncultured Hymenobacter sp.]|uniref:energy transducer TonB n=1 Tax=uncultured Hymenobacter sp. TaxID=170016 RepID=UPI0035CBD09D